MKFPQMSNQTKFKIKGLTVVFLMLGLLGFPTFASAATTEWFEAGKLKTITKRLSKAGDVPMSVQCRYVNRSIGEGRRSTLLKFTYRKNSQKLRWRTAWGNQIPLRHKRATKKGYKRVSYRTFRRPSGLRLGCAIWHRK